MPDFCEFVPVPDYESCKNSEPTVNPIPETEVIVFVDPVEPTPELPVKEDESPKKEPATEPKMEGEEKKEMEAQNPMMMMGNFAFLGVAAGHVAGISLDLFRYKSDADYYIRGKSYDAADDQTNWW